MAVYIVLFALAVILGIILTGRKTSGFKKILYLSVMFFLMWALCTFRYGLGNDYFSYIRIFDEINVSSVGDALTLGYEPAFTLLTKLITLISSDPEIMYGIYAMLILAPVAYAIYRYSDNVWISVTVYLCLTFYYTSLNFIRQSMAVSLLILCYGFIKKRKIVPVLIFSVLAALFHYTALVFIPFYLLAYFVKPTKKAIIIYSSVSLGTLITCLVMKAAGANPLNLAAQLITAVTGKDYTGYISSQWFEDGFGVEYLIMPFAVLALVMICYFLGWKEKEDSHVLLWFMLGNASVWSFIVYAFIVERFSMFIFIFSVFAIPSALHYFREKAENAALAEKTKTGDRKKTPGYSKKRAEEKSDNIFLVTVVTVSCMFIYNCWGLYKNFHGVSPYMFNNPTLQDATDGLDTSEENFEKMYTNADIYTYLIQLKNVDCGYAILSTTDNYGGFIPGVRRAAAYAGTGLDLPTADKPYYVEYNSRGDEAFTEASAGEISYTTSEGVRITCNGETGVVTDTEGKTAEIGKGRLMFVLFYDDGTILDATEYNVDLPQRRAAKVEIK